MLADDEPNTLQNYDLEPYLQELFPLPFRDPLQSKVLETLQGRTIDLLILLEDQGLGESHLAVCRRLGRGPGRILREGGQGESSDENDRGEVAHVRLHDV